MAPSERRAGIVGTNIGYSLSPVLHSAAYGALGLDWTYSRLECDAEGLPALVEGLGPEWAGLSVTMPGKRAALTVASHVTERARLVGAGNTLVHQPDGSWHVDCTDVDGVAGALLYAGGYQPTPGAHAVLLGAGGTALAAIVALAEASIDSFALVVRDPASAADALQCAERLDVKIEVHRWADTDFGKLVAAADVLVSTVPAGVADVHVEDLASAPCVVDVIYHPWPTPLAAAVQARGGRTGTGLDMLLHQAFGQVTQFTGMPAPREVMRDALVEATGGTLPLPLA
ncbi:shikimate dehydrogenase [Kibdelosporangium banguiense]|uniref:Shikimate dehydrogenase n=1 Tax=Kibdelosporangium banguiense TaxID=1365924 RepID=A0ABS4U0L2_9PSEU|nr:shikimate dehydrogenase [Kibdelosporangium banguiense]MBP2330198.1 shikimate dehydrogenase [Kibdelosporangium banguiense]